MVVQGSYRLKETVDSLHYRIIAWGYYGNDNPKLTPRTWVDAVYLKLKKLKKQFSVVYNL